MSIDITQTNNSTSLNDVDLLGLVGDSHCDDIMTVRLESQVPELLPPTNGSSDYIGNNLPTEGDGGLADLNNSMSDLNLWR